MSRTGEHKELLVLGWVIGGGSLERGAGAGITGARVHASHEIKPGVGLGGVGGSTQAN